MNAEFSIQAERLNFPEMSLNLRERQRQLREEVIVDAAYALLTEQGYEAMNMDDVAARVGISKATLYQHFPSKEDLAVNVIVRSLTLAMQDVQAQAQAPEPAIRRLERCLRMSFQRRLEFGQAGLILPLMVIKKHPRYVAAFGKLTALLEAIVNEAKAEGSVDPALSSPVIIHVALAVIRTDLEEILTSNRITPDELLDTLIAVILRGTRASPA